MAKTNRSSIKDEQTYEALREDGASKEKAARIANASANGSMDPQYKGGKRSAYENWTVSNLRRRAAELEISGRSRMRKTDLIKALRQR
ncbi:MAG: Rho termination factor N-terminal domain-containing protein [Pseudomonadota bacterium]